MQSLVSVIIPNYNGGKYLTQALENKFSQNYSNIEVIVIDNGSTDDSLSQVSLFQGRIKICKSENFGAASARNVGLLEPKGDLIAFLDSDDLWMPNKLSMQVTLLESENLDLVYCSGQEFTDNNALGLVHSAQYKGYCYQFYKNYPSHYVLAISPSGVALRKSIIRKSGIFETQIPAPTESWDSFRRYCQFAKVGYCSEVLVMRRIHDNNISKQSLLGYNRGNRNSIQKMFIDDSSIVLVEKRVIWTRFHHVSFKGFIKNGDMTLGILALVQILSLILK